ASLLTPADSAPDSGSHHEVAIVLGIRRGYSSLVASLRTWRFVYTSSIAAGLAALFGAGMVVQRGKVLPNVSEGVVGCVVLAIFALLWLRPRPHLYAFGELCLSAALFILWL